MKLQLFRVYFAGGPDQLVDVLVAGAIDHVEALEQVRYHIPRGATLEKVELVRDYNGGVRSFALTREEGDRQRG